MVDQTRGVALVLAENKVRLQKVGMAYKQRVAMACIIVYPYHVFLNFTLHVIQSGITRTKCDPVDLGNLTRFQCCLQPHT